MMSPQVPNALEAGHPSAAEPAKPRTDQNRNRHANLSGQVMGTKGLATRRRLMIAMIELLESVAARDLTVKSIASKAGLSPATFYLYFRSVRECLLAATGSISQSTPAVLGVLDRDWGAGAAGGNALSLVMDHLEVWEQHRTLLRVRNLVAEEKDRQFVAQRRLSMGPAVRALAGLAERHRKGGRLEADVAPMALASALFAMLDLVSSVIHVHDGKQPSVELDHIKAAAYVIAASLGSAE